MRTVKVLLVLAVVAVFTTGAIAQDGATKAKKRKGAKLMPVSLAMMRIERLHEALKKVDLTEEQQEQLKDLHKAIGPELKEVMGQILAVVGDEKVKTVKETVKSAKEAGKNHWQVAVAVEKALDLSDEQKEKLTKVGQELMKLQRGLTKKSKAVLTTEQNEKLTKLLAPRKRTGKKGKQKQDK